MSDNGTPLGDWPAMPDMAHAVADLRALARQGLLAQTARGASRADRVRLSGAAYAVAGPVVFSRWTRALELRRGHRACATSVRRLVDACLDRYYDDIEAVVEDILTHATVPIHNLEGWIVPRLRAATVDAHRRRRGRIGALQRPRLPGWLKQDLRDDPWLCQLALEILTWVGVSATSGTAIWPLDSWAGRRGALTGDWTGSDARTVQVEVEGVLAVMRRRPRWYDDYVERPLGAKPAPVAPSLVTLGPPIAEPPALALTEPHEIYEARLTMLATTALGAIETGLAKSDVDIRALVTSVISTVFGRIDLDREIADVPHAAPGEDERVVVLLEDPAEVDRIVGAILAILHRCG